MKMLSLGRVHDRIASALGLRTGDRVHAAGYLTASLYDAQGRLLVRDAGPNLIPDVGLQFLLENDVVATPLYIGLLAASPSITGATTGATITLTDVPFSQATRPTWTKSRSGQQLSNSGSLGRFDFTGAGTNGLGGAFISASSSKSDATAGNLLAARAFTAGNLGAVAAGYYLDIQYNLTLTAA